MKVFITSAYPYHEIDNFAVVWLKESQHQDTFKEHKIVDDPENADLILFAEHHPGNDPYFFKVLKHPLVKKYRHRVVLYTDTDSPLPILPTLSPSIEKSYLNPAFCLPAPYIARHCENESVTFSNAKSNRKYLFSFLGASRTHPIRKKILKLAYSDCYLEDTSEKNSWELTLDEKKIFESKYANISKDSYFILCPRGIGVNSYRLYETMQMGLVPVIISDEWIPMHGPNWKEFSIQIMEKDIQKIPEILFKRKGDAINMGLMARENWERWFSKEVSFHHITNLAKSLLIAKSNNISNNFYFSFTQFLRPFHFRNFLRYIKNDLLNKIK
tara:strand:+ start:11293 stop:12276 length:984 start_codon:yes stop_codon:yes gene_type:complete